MHRPLAAAIRALVSVGAAGLLAIAMAGCSEFTPSTPMPTPTDFQGIVEEMAASGVGVIDVVSGDAGCDDQRLARTAISFEASGLDQPTRVRIHLYAFRDTAVYEELRPGVDACARAYVSDASTFNAVDASPYVLAGQGPWGPAFKDALREALTRAARGG